MENFVVNIGYVNSMLYPWGFNSNFIVIMHAKDLKPQD